MSSLPQQQLPTRQEIDDAFIIMNSPQASPEETTAADNLLLHATSLNVQHPYLPYVRRASVAANVVPTVNVPVAANATNAALAAGTAAAITAASLGADKAQSVLIANAAAEAASSAAPHSLSSKDPKLPDVPMFNGDPKKSFEFLSQLRIFFVLQPNRYSTDLHKSYYLGMRCEGPAAVWFNGIVSKPDSHVALGVFDHLLAQFQLIFDDPTRLQDAERKLLSFKQGKRSVAAMVPDFQTLVFVTGWPPEHLFRIFLNALNENVKDELLKESRPPVFNDFILRAIAIDRQLTERNQDRQVHRPPQQQLNLVQVPVPPAAAALPPPAAAAVHPAVALNAANVARAPGPLTAAERQHRIQNNLCMYCGVAGHQQISCARRMQRFQ